jgi:hypothetical protein
LFNKFKLTDKQSISYIGVHMLKYFSILVLLLSSYANASLVTLQSLDINNTFDHSVNFKSYWDANAGTKSDPTLLEFETFENIRTGGHHLNLLSIEFDLNSDALFSIFAGLDAHYGAEIYIQEELVYSEYANLWWNNNWEHMHVIELPNTMLSAGRNLVEVFWAESCCNGPNSVMFAFDNEEPLFLNLRVLNTEAAKVSAPKSLALMGLGLFGLIGLSNKKKIKN